MKRKPCSISANLLWKHHVNLALLQGLLLLQNYSDIDIHSNSLLGVLLTCPEKPRAAQRGGGLKWKGDLDKLVSCPNMYVFLDSTS